ncbi:MAG: hypothetical protein PHV34_24480 [Verrucomicrobiae bacterium]|nr:hypothetical protein [Verrucomicrobiae bacterium]
MMSLKRSAVSDAPPDGCRNEKGESVFRCGNLVYTRKGLVFLFAWMLWGDFCFTLMEAVVPSILPLKLKSLESANWLIGAIMSTLPGIFNTTVCPWVSFKSDRYRSKWGRRIPFILYTMPFLTVSLIMIGCSDSLGAWVHGAFFQGSGVRQASVIIILLAVFAGSFDLFNMFVGSVYAYLFNDVVPEQFMGRFMGYFRLVGVASGAGFNFFVFKYAESHMREIYLGAALLYFAGFGLMCLKVKEREYPPFLNEGRAPGLLDDIRTFARECYSISFYWNIFLDNVCGAVGQCMLSFLVFFYMSVGLNLDLIGKITAISGVLTAVCLAFAGSFVDKWHPVRVSVYLVPLTSVATLNWCAWLWIEGAPPPMLFFWAMVTFCVFNSFSIALIVAASMPRTMALFPHERYGQFCGAQALLRSGGTMFGGVLAGLFIDFARGISPGGHDAYRFIYVWQLVFGAASAFFYCRSYRAWKRLGAERGYVPPSKRFSMRELLARPPMTPADSVCFNHSLAGIGGLVFFGLLIFDLVFAVYYGFFNHQVRNAVVFSVQAALILALAPMYPRLLRFIERD